MALFFLAYIQYTNSQGFYLFNVTQWCPNVFYFVEQTKVVSLLASLHAFNCSISGKVEWPIISLDELVLSHFSSSLLLAIGDRHPNPPGFAFPRGVTGWVPWEADSEISTKCAGGLLGSAFGIDSWERKEKRKKKEGKEKDRMGRMSRKEKEGSKTGQKKCSWDLVSVKAVAILRGAAPKLGWPFKVVSNWEWGTTALYSLLISRWIPATQGDVTLGYRGFSAKALSC